LGALQAKQSHRKQRVRAAVQPTSCGGPHRLVFTGEFLASVELFGSATRLDVLMACVEVEKGLNRT
jgi:hypothetical protein